jgi:hypothetical protein
MVSIHPAAAGNEWSWCIAINANGRILGAFDDPITLKDRGFVELAGVVSVFGDPSTDVYPRAINNNDVVVGMVDSGANYLPFRWPGSGTIQYISLLPGTTGGEAMAVNNAGDIVGYMGDFAFLYRNGNTYKLFELIAGIQGASGWTSLGGADFINDNNDIVGWGIYLGEYKTFRLHVPP